MKTIVTVLPIYDSINKQAFQRGRKAGVDIPTYSVKCSQSQLPAFQWSDNGEGATSVSQIDLVTFEGISTNITALLTVEAVALTADTYFTCSGVLSSSIDCGHGYLKITMDNAAVYYSDWFNACDVSDLLLFNFYNSCDLGNLLYQTSWQQFAWIDSETMEPSFPLVDEGATNGEGRFIRTFARQVKKYSVKTLPLPAYMVEVFNRMLLHDNIFLTDTLGDENEVLNLEVENEWFETDKNYALITLTFDYDETFVVSGCCNNLV